MPYWPAVRFAVILQLSMQFTSKICVRSSKPCDNALCWPHAAGTKTDGFFYFPTSDQLALHTDHLQQFMSRVGSAALAGVIPVDILLTLTPPTKQSQPPDSLKGLDITSHLPTPSSPAGVNSHAISGRCDLAAALVAACPNVRRLRMAGSLGEASMRLFGSHWPKLTSLELLDHFHNNSKTSSVLSTYMLAGITRFCHSQGSCGGQASSILKLFACPSVTHLDLDHHLFGSEQDWCLPPAGIEVLRTGSSRVPAMLKLLPSLMRFARLEQIQVWSMHLVMTVALLATLLRVAPSLKTLAERPDWKPKTKMPNTLILGDSSSLLLDDIHLFHERSLSGFTLQGATLDCTCDTSYEESSMLQSTAQMLLCIPSAHSYGSLCTQPHPTIIVCTLALDTTDRSRTHCNGSPHTGWVCI